MTEALADVYPEGLSNESDCDQQHPGRGVSLFPNASVRREFTSTRMLLCEK